MVRNILKPNVLSAQCPSRRALDPLAGKGTTLVIHRLAGGTCRHSDLHRSLDGISIKEQP